MAVAVGVALDQAEIRSRAGQIVRLDVDLPAVMRESCGSQELESLIAGDGRIGINGREINSVGLAYIKVSLPVPPMRL